MGPTTMLMLPVVLLYSQHLLLRFYLVFVNGVGSGRITDDVAGCTAVAEGSPTSLLDNDK